MRQLLQDSTIASIMFQKFFDTCSALNKLRDMVTTNTTRGHMAYQTEEANLEFLQNVLAGGEWAKLAFTQC